MAYRTHLDDLWEHQIRPDGRTPNELRNVCCEMSVFRDTRASGSAAFSIGNTKVVGKCILFVDKSLPLIRGGCSNRQV